MKDNNINNILKSFDSLIFILENTNYKSLSTIVKGLKFVFFKDIKK